MISLWEIALVIVASTFMMVNLASLVVSLMFTYKFGGLFNKSARMMEKMIDQAEKELDRINNN